MRISASVSAVDSFGKTVEQDRYCSSKSIKMDLQKCEYCGIMSFGRVFFLSRNPVYKDEIGGYVAWKLLTIPQRRCGMIYQRK